MGSSRGTETELRLGSRLWGLWGRRQVSVGPKRDLASEPISVTLSIRAEIINHDKIKDIEKGGESDEVRLKIKR